MTLSGLAPAPKFSSPALVLHRQARKAVRPTFGTLGLDQTALPESGPAKDKALNLRVTSAISDLLLRATLFRYRRKASAEQWGDYVLTVLPGQMERLATDGYLSPARLTRLIDRYYFRPFKGQAFTSIRHQFRDQGVALAQAVLPAADFRRLVKGVIETEIAAVVAPGVIRSQVVPKVVPGEYDVIIITPSSMQQITVLENLETYLGDSAALRPWVDSRLLAQKLRRILKDSDHPRVYHRVLDIAEQYLSRSDLAVLEPEFAESSRGATVLNRERMAALLQRAETTNAGS